MTDSEATPALAIIAGQPTAQETAAVVVVLSALRGQVPTGPARDWQLPARAAAGTGSPQWSAPSRMLRAPVAAGPGAWRRSALPH